MTELLIFWHIVSNIPNLTLIKQKGNPAQNRILLQPKKGEKIPNRTTPTAHAPHCCKANTKMSEIFFSFNFLDTSHLFCINTIV